MKKRPMSKLTRLAQRISMAIVIVFSLLNASQGFSNNTCEDFDPLDTYEDGMPKCAQPLQSGRSAAAQFGCARNQSRRFRAVTSFERTALADLFLAYKQSLIEGISSITTQTMMAAAADLRMQVCRVRLTDSDHQIKDSRLLFYTKNGINDFSGALFILREINPSRLVIFGPHDGSDGTYASTKIALEGTHAMATFSNGYNRKYAPMVGKNRGDMARLNSSLGFATMQEFFSQFPKMLVFHVHGNKGRDFSIFRSRSTSNRGRQIGPLLKQVILENTAVTRVSSQFNAYYQIEEQLNTGTYVKIEFPTSRQLRTPGVIRRILNALMSDPKLSWSRQWTPESY